MKTLKRFVLVGGPASGKGTQGRFLSETFNLETLSTGALLRREIAACSDLGRRAQSYMDRAMLVPDEVVNDIVRGWLSDSSDSSWILDGYPRTVAQAEVLDNFLKERGSQIDVVVWMDVARELIETRISQRRECSSCGLIVQDANSHVCPECGGEMVARNDDGIESFRRRWKDYEAMTLPVARYYEAKGLVVRIKLDQERPREEVSQELLLKLKAFAE